MKHFICTGDCGTTEQLLPGQCTTDTCSQAGKPLIECKCTDNSHAGLLTPCPDCGSYCQKTGVCEPAQR